MSSKYGHFIKAIIFIVSIIFLFVSLFCVDNNENLCDDFLTVSYSDASIVSNSSLSTTFATVTSVISNNEKVLTTNATSSATKTAKATKKSTTTVVTSNTTSNKLDNAEFVENPDYKSKYYIVVFKGSQSTVVYGKDDNGAYTKTIKVFTCSTGKEKKPTKTGMYNIFAKYRWRWLVGNVYGQYNSSIGNDYLFHSVPYYKKDASTLENEEYDKLGSPASKGCIRMCVRDTKWIYDNCPIGTQVHIVDAVGPDGMGVPPRINSDSIYDGWDPSDQWAKGNPYFQNFQDIQESN